MRVLFKGTIALGRIWRHPESLPGIKETLGKAQEQADQLVQRLGSEAGFWAGGGFWEFWATKLLEMNMFLFPYPGAFGMLLSHMSYQWFVVPVIHSREPLNKKHPGVGKLGGNQRELDVHKAALVPAGNEAPQRPRA